VVFFVVLYGVLTYGFVFAAQHAVNLAAQDGARRMLQWREGASSLDALDARAQAARDAALDLSAWIATLSAAPVAVAVCGSGGLLQASGGGACSGHALEQDQAEVTVSYAYGAHPLIPVLPLLGQALVPDSLVLRARALVRLGGAMDGGQ